MSRASKIRSSNPSKRPQRRMTPLPAASSRTRLWVRAPRAGSARALGDRRRHCPPPQQARPARTPSLPRRPPACHLRYGACRSRSRGSWRVSSDQVLSASALPGKADAKRSREHLRVKGEDGGGEGHGCQTRAPPPRSTVAAISRSVSRFVMVQRVRRGHHGSAVVAVSDQAAPSATEARISSYSPK